MAAHVNAVVDIRDINVPNPGLPPGFLFAPINESLLRYRLLASQVSEGGRETPERRFWVKTRDVVTCSFGYTD